MGTLCLEAWEDVAWMRGEDDVWGKAFTPVGPAGLTPGQGLGSELRDILRGRRLTARFQPIVDLRTGRTHGFEGLVRGPSDSLLHPPLALFRAARMEGCVVLLEEACLETVLASAAPQMGEARLFLNVSPACLEEVLGPLPALVARLGMDPGSIVLELTETPPGVPPEALRRTVAACRGAGFRIALDDLGEGMSSLRLWLDLQPDYVKVDKGFVQGVALDPVKLAFLRTLASLGHATGSLLVAEGIENEADLAVVQDLGMDLGQGYLLGRPAPEALVPVLPFLNRSAGEAEKARGARRMTAGALLQPIQPVRPDTPCNTVVDRFIQEPELQSLPVVEADLPVGLLYRQTFMDFMARPFSRELYGKRPCATRMSGSVLVVDHRLGLPDLSRLIVESDPHHILHGFVITRNGAYAGVGSGHDLMREITQLQVAAARHSNPLTGLPGNVPIHEQLDDLLAQGESFVAAYVDLDHFKAFNDVFGYQKGDEVIQFLGRLLEQEAGVGHDFVGHIGGDDFLLVMRGPGWEARCRAILAAFDAERARFFTPQVVEAGGYEAEDRQGRMVFHPLLSLSIGAVRVARGRLTSHHEIAEAATAAKRQAKRERGSSLFIERRRSPRLCLAVSSSVLETAAFDEPDHRLTVAGEG